ncbi:MAG: MFS transporter [Anaerolineae bacterium]
MTRPADRTLLGVSIGHAAHDAWFGVAPIMLASLSLSMGLTNAQIGLMLLLYQVFSSVSQPAFGRLAERIGGRPLAVGAILWTTTLFSGALFAESPLVLGLFIALAGLGSGAWHPQGSANATIAGGERWGATAASVFFLGGSLGTALLGSALGGALLGAYGRPALLVISGITVLLALTVVRRMVPRRLAARSPEASAASTAPSGAASDTATVNGGALFWTLLICLLLATALRSLTYHTLNTYVPRYQQELGMSVAGYGLLMSLFTVAIAVGGVAGAYLADHVGIRRVLIGTMVLAAILLGIFLRAQGFVSAAALVVGGLFLGPSHTLFVVAAQRRFPQRIATISGLILGFTFFSGAGGAWLLGLLADRVSLGVALAILPWALVGAALVSLVAVPRTAVQGRTSQQAKSEI